MIEVPAYIWFGMVVGGLLVLAFVAFRLIRRRELSEVRKFRSRADHTDAAFIAELGIVAGTVEAANAAALRRAFAEFGEVPPESLKASTRFYPDLERLPFYDSLDATEFVLVVEEVLGINIPDEDIAGLFRPVVKEEATVGGFTTAILAYAERHRNRLPQRGGRVSKQDSAESR